MQPGQFADARNCDKPLSELWLLWISANKQRRGDDLPSGKKCIRADKLEFNNRAFVQAGDKATTKTSGGGAINCFCTNARPRGTDEMLLLV